MNENTKLIHFKPESLIFTKETSPQSNQTKIKVSGTAIPYGKLSRNGVRYRDESVRKAAPTLNGVSFLFNHNTDRPIGHVESQISEEDGIHYAADLDPGEEDIVRKVGRGDIRHASIGAIVANPVFNEDGTVEVDIDEFVELSLVPVPGFKDATAVRESFGVSELTPLMLAEKFGNEDFVNKMKNKKECLKNSEEGENNDAEPVGGSVEAVKFAEGVEKKKKAKAKDDDDDEKEDDKDDDDDEKETLKENAPTVEEQISELANTIKELSTKNEEMDNRLAIVEARLDALENSSESVADEEEGEEESDEEKAETVNRQAIPKGSAHKQKVVINANDLRLKNSSY
jgi:HK97 family phage prohead protease